MNFVLKINNNAYIYLWKSLKVIVANSPTNDGYYISIAS